MRRCQGMAAIVRARRGVSQIAIFKIERAGFAVAPTVSHSNTWEGWPGWPGLGRFPTI